jgi:hypothetical protein
VLVAPNFLQTVPDLTAEFAGAAKKVDASTVSAITEICFFMGKGYFYRSDLSVPDLGLAKWLTLKIGLWMEL